MGLLPPPRHPRANRPLAVGLTLVVLAGVLAGLVYGFAPGLPRQIARAALTAINLDPPKPSPPPKLPPPPAHQDAGASGAAGKKAVAAPVPAAARIAVKPLIAPSVAATGSAMQSGALAAGPGSGAAGTGSGTGSGAGGSGAGRKAEKIAGEIADKDYPKAGRALRLGHSVTVVLTISVDGRVSDCVVRDAGPDPEADAITCRLIRQRFRYRPATNALGQPVESRTGWRQSWYY